MGVNPRVVSVLRGYTLPFKQRPLLTRFPLVQSGYINPVKNRFLKEALLNLMSKLVVEKVVVKSSLAFHNWLFLLPKPNRKWRPILDLSQLNLYLSINTFKMETPETIRVILTDRGMGDVAGLQRRIFPHSNQSKVMKISEVFPVQSDLPIRISPLWSGHSSPRVWRWLRK